MKYTVMESIYFNATPITDNYHWGMLGEFKVIIRTKDMYLNITKLCKEGGKDFKHWKDKNTGKRTIAYYDKIILASPDQDWPKSCVSVVNSGDPTVKGLPEETIRILQGTYVPCRMAIAIAQWISDEFSDKVSGIVLNYYNRQLVVSNKEKDTENSELKQMILDLKTQNNAILAKQDIMDNKLNKILSLACSFKDLLKPEPGNREVVLIIEEIDGGFSIRCGQKISLKPYMKKSKSYTLYENISNSKRALRYLKDNDILPRNDGRSVTYKELDKNTKDDVYAFFKEVDKLYKQDV